MKLSRNKMLLVSFMLFSLFFGAGNLIFPPFLGQNAGSHTLPAMLGFLATAVVLPVLGVVVVARFDGLDRLGQQVGKRFAIVFTLLIYLSIGPGLGIPRAASVPFEMAVAPYLPESANTTVWMLVYSLVFFLVALWLCMTPGKLVNRIGHFLTPSLLVLLVFLFVCFLFRGEVNVAPSQTAYDAAPFLKGFSEGYQTMDTIAALNFGLVIATTLGSFGMTEKRDRMRHTVLAGIFAGTILALVYAMLSYMGMCSSGVYPIQENGAWTLRCIVYQLFGAPGAVLLAAIFTLACLTTCVGLINSISQYFSTLFGKLSYRQWVLVMTGFSFLVCNLGLNAILSISIPILNAIYPVAIVLILLSFLPERLRRLRAIYPAGILFTGAASILYTVQGLGAAVPVLDGVLSAVPLAEAVCSVPAVLPSWKWSHTAWAVFFGRIAASVSSSASRMARMVPRRRFSSACRLVPRPGMPSSAERMVLLVWRWW